MSGFVIRSINESEWDAFGAAVNLGFGLPPNLDWLDDARQTLDIDRTMAVFDGDEIVGTGGAFTFNTCVPGGALLPTGGVTMITVRATHRRQGVLRRMMEHQLKDIHERGEPIATLWASESSIYGRFGYGLSAEGMEVRIARDRTALAMPPLGNGKTRLVSQEEALEKWPEVFDRYLPTRPGAHSRSRPWWRHHSIFEGAGSRKDAQFFVQYEEGGRVDGFARYLYERKWVDGNAAGILHVLEMIAATDAAHQGLWSYLFGVDLVETIRVGNRPVDDPITWMLAEPRRLFRRVQDTLWVRILDVTRALESRRYSAEGSLTLEVADTFCPWAAGRYHLEAGPAGAKCQPASGEPDISLGAADLGAVYLGGVRFQTLAAAGRASGDPEALRLADAMFAWHPIAWSPEDF